MTKRGASETVDEPSGDLDARAIAMPAGTYVTEATFTFEAIDDEERPIPASGV